jgi:dihydrofolate reductase
MELVVTENITLDGVIDVTGGWFDPTTDEEVDESDVLATVQAEMARQDALLLGRVTFEEFRGFWPQQADDTTGISAHLAAVRKLVASRTLGFDPGWERTTVLRGPLEQEVERLKARPGGVLGVTGSVSVVRQLVAAGLVDVYRLYVYPVVMGRGTRLFEDATAVGRLRLVEATPFRNGVVLMTYRP